MMHTCKRFFLLYKRQLLTVWRAKDVCLIVLSTCLLIGSSPSHSADLPSAASDNDVANLNCNNRSADWIFCEDFEGGDLSAWDPQTPSKKGSLKIVEQPSVTTARNHVLQLRVNPGRGGIGLNKTITSGTYDRLYARWYQKYEPGFDFSARNHGHGFHAGDRWKKGVAGMRPQGDDYFTVQLEYETATRTQVPRPFIYAYYRGMYMDCRDPKGQCWGDHLPCMIEQRYCRQQAHRPVAMPPVLTDDRWYCIELMVDAGDAVQQQSTANGELNFWVDGQSYGPWENMWFRTSDAITITQFWLGLFHHSKHAEQGIRYDNVVISRSRVGCGPAPGSTTDTISNPIGSLNN